MTITTRMDVPEATWRLGVLQEIETDGGTLDARQVAVLHEALRVIAADSSFRNATPAGDAAPSFGSGTGPAPKQVVRKLSDKQLFHLRKELPRRNTDAIAVKTAAELLARCDRDGTDPLETVPMRLASDALSNLFGAPFRPFERTVPAVSASAPVAARSDALPVTETGAYRNAAGEIFRVQASRGTDRLYAKRLDSTTGKFDYVKGAIYTLTADMRMTLEQAMEFGKESARAAKEAGRPHGICIFGHGLTDPKSIAKGIGPICESRI